MLIFGDSPNRSDFTPWVTWSLIALNCLVFVGQLLGWIDDDMWSFRPGAPSVTTALTAVFLHGSLLHLLGNMLYLWVFGDNVEDRLGHVPFVVLWVWAGLMAQAGHMLVRPGSMVPSLGASGAISGVLGAYFLLFPENQVMVLVPPQLLMAVSLFRSDMGRQYLVLNARWVLGVWVALDVIPILIGAEDGIGHGAHLGGFATGMLVGAVLYVFAHRVLSPVVPEVGRAATPHLARARALAEQGLLIDAFQEYKWAADHVESDDEREVVHREMRRLPIHAHHLAMLGLEPPPPPPRRS